ncbi:HAMP domain-containing sensor histidine kinase [Streptomyces sp. 11-1-2]|uniref:HAMP domain-containing sensor histidine kinase n=1 Tax=unclassified Streptomyces TaxID=2593676 RepID=UPI000B8D7872|nr:HAMP domain-containing sensor histidine kinase [Streptomyces sp. 11-1-2]ASQ96099.1 two-component sensor histidine kinase [Streptomyces sp. 11-1-2]
MRFHRLPLRSRLALLTAVAVAVAVAVSAFASWLIVREQLSAQLDSSLRNVKVDERNVLSILEACQSPGGADGHTPRALGSYSVQIVLADGSRCTQPGATQLPVTTADVEVAVGQRPSALHDATGAGGGGDMRVYTYRPTEGPGSPLPRGIAVSMARPLSEVQHPLSTLTLVLALVAGVGVVGAGAAGLWIARTGLKPVDRLTEAVEHVARTEDLAVRIPAEGDDEIARLSRSFNSMTAALTSSRDRQQQLIADAGHELRTPLTSLRTNIELLARSDETGRALPPADRKALMGSVKAQMTELAALIGDLQELSRPDALPGSGPPQVIALHEVARTALERARLRGAHLTINASIEPWYVRGEAATLERSLVNLLDNAVKFSPSGGVIDVVLRSGEVRVRDHGPGIPAEELPHVFERFWRSPSARSMPGSGLGLSIVARTVQQAGGQVGLEAAPGGGTVAWIKLPGAPTAPPGIDVD